MKLPNSIRIGGVEYPVVYVENLNNGTNMAYGHISFDDCQIELSDNIGIAHERRCQTLLHEILHGIIYHASANIENEEVVVECLAKGLYQVLQDNGRRLFDIVEDKAESNE